MVIVTALKRHLFCIQSEKIAPEGYPSISSINFIKEYEVCDVWISVPEEGKRPMRNLKAFVKTHLPDIFLQLLLYKVYKCKYWKKRSEPTRCSLFSWLSVSCLQSICVGSLKEDVIKLNMTASSLRNWGQNMICEDTRLSLLWDLCTV